MTLRSRALAAFSAAAVVLALTACASGSPDSSSTAADDNPYGLIQPGVLRAGTLTDAPPNVYIEDGEFTGFDNELLVAGAVRLLARAAAGTGRTLLWVFSARAAALTDCTSFTASARWWSSSSHIKSTTSCTSGDRSGRSRA